MKTALSLIALAALAGAASAADYITGGTLTANDPTYHRALTPTTLSGVGTATHYDTFAFHVTVTGTYAAEMYTAGTFDPFLYVYNPFTPSAALTGLVNGDDDYTGALPILGATSANALHASRIITGDTTNLKTGGLALSAGVTYTAVATAFSNSGLGDYRLGIGGGPGSVLAGPVPEPASMLALGLGAAAMLRRRKKA